MTDPPEILDFANRDNRPPASAESVGSLMATIASSALLANVALWGGGGSSFFYAVVLGLLAAGLAVVAAMRRGSNAWKIAAVACSALHWLIFLGLSWGRQ